VLAPPLSRVDPVLQYLRDRPTLYISHNKEFLCITR